jgi:glycosyltransferase 2 family protein
MMNGRGRRISAFLARHLRSWVLGLALLLGLILVVTHLGELEGFLTLARDAEPLWVLVALGLQMFTYVCAAGVWHQALRRAGTNVPLRTLVPLGVAKLFSDQALPSGGISGAGFFVAALRRHHVPSELCMATLVLSVITHYLAYLVLALVSLLLLWQYHSVQAWVISVLGLFALVAVVLPTVLLVAQFRGRSLFAPLLRYWPSLEQFFEKLDHAPSKLVKSPILLFRVTVLQAAVFLLDAATLWVLLQAIGVEVSLWVALPSFMVASMVATLSPVPLGLGTFETACVAMLTLLGVQLEAALTATLLLRGLTLWLPMLPGLWLVRRTFR